MWMRRTAMVAVVAAGVVMWALLLRDPQVQSKRPTDPPGEPGIGLARAERIRSELIASSPAIESGALADGVVTLTEYRVAVSRVIRCLKAAIQVARPRSSGEDVTMVGPWFTVDHFDLRFDYRLSGSAGNLDPRPLDRRCQDRNSRHVAAMYHLQRRTDPESLARSDWSFKRCVAHTGVRPRAGEGPRAYFRRVLRASDLSPSARREAGRCIADHPSVGDLEL